ncbi:MAG: hypothetical protein H0U44_02835 [Flavisolibacter sp.]|jgi:hypothetical protein|nr:hypothetical protein [Flavisolibacter sp.]
MIRGILNTILWILAIISIGYAIYRSTSVKEVLIQGNREIIYGEPQHGLIFGLFFLAAGCIIGSVILVLHSRDIRITEREDLSKRTL